MSKVYQIKNWHEHFENNRTRDLKEMHWVPVPNRMDGDGYTELVTHANGAAHLGAWLAIVEIASRCDVRGTLMRDSAKAHDSTSLSRLSRLPAAIFDEVLPRLIEIGWLEVVELETTQSTATSRIPQEGAGIPQEGAPSRARAERNGMEKNGMEKKPTRARGAGSAKNSEGLNAQEYIGQLIAFRRGDLNVRKLPSEQGEAAAAKYLFEQGWSVQQIQDCYHDLKKQKWRGTPISLITVKQSIADWAKGDLNTESGNDSRAQSKPGKSVGTGLAEIEAARERERQNAGTT